jgi:hypothetical protein
MQSMYYLTHCEEYSNRFIFQTTSRDIKAIKADHTKHQLYKVDGTDWSDSEDPEPLPISKSETQLHVKAANAKTKQPPSPRTEQSNSEGPQTQPISEPGSLHQTRAAAEKEKKPLVARKIDCDACGVSGNECTMTTVLKQCSSCQKWSHARCMENQATLNLCEIDGTWKCPSCREIIIWTDNK